MKTYIGVAVAAVLMATPAFAADLAVKAPPARVAPVFSWTGWYIGANLGGAWARDPENFTLGSGGGIGFNQTNTARSSSLVGGGQIGYNYQINNVVLGVEADIDGRHNANDFSCPVLSPIGCVAASGSVLTLHDEQDWFGTFRGRLGLTFDHVLLYGTGGLAYGEVQHSVTEAVVGASLVFSDRTTRAGWAAGVGGEYAINNQWSIGVEYLHLDLGTDTLVSAGAAPIFGPSNATFKDRSDILRAKLNWHLNWPGVATR